MGRGKAPTEYIRDKCQRHITFSKRRAGLYKKAARGLCSRGCDVAIIVFSCVGNAFSFASPDVETVVGRYRPADTQAGGEGGVAAAEKEVVGWRGKDEEDEESEETARDEFGSDAMVTEEGEEEEAISQAEGGLEHREEEVMEEEIAWKSESYWWNNEVEELGAAELRELERWMVRLRYMVKERIDDLLGKEPLRLCSWLS